eukprot:6030717-Amphidinium_carterae.1
MLHSCSFAGVNCDTSTPHEELLASKFSHSYKEHNFPRPAAQCMLHESFSKSGLHIKLELEGVRRFVMKAAIFELWVFGAPNLREESEHMSAFRAPTSLVPSPTSRGD